MDNIREYTEKERTSIASSLLRLYQSIGGYFSAEDQCIGQGNIEKLIFDWDKTISEFQIKDFTDIADILGNTVDINKCHDKYTESTKNQNQSTKNKLREEIVDIINNSCERVYDFMSEHQTKEFHISREEQQIMDTNKNIPQDLKNTVIDKDMIEKLIQGTLTIGNDLKYAEIDIKGHKDKINNAVESQNIITPLVKIESKLMVDSLKASITQLKRTDTVLSHKIADCMDRYIDNAENAVSAINKSFYEQENHIVSTTPDARTLVHNLSETCFIAVDYGKIILSNEIDSLKKERDLQEKISNPAVINNMKSIMNKLQFCVNQDTAIAELSDIIKSSKIYDLPEIGELAQLYMNNIEKGNPTDTQYYMSEFNTKADKIIAKTINEINAPYEPSISIQEFKTALSNPPINIQKSINSLLYFKEQISDIEQKYGINQTFSVFVDNELENKGVIDGNGEITEKLPSQSEYHKILQDVITKYRSCSIEYPYVYPMHEIKTERAFKTEQQTQQQKKDVLNDIMR